MNAPTAAPVTLQPRLQPIADGCYRDTAVLYRNAEGKLCFFEFTPILNPDDTCIRADGLKLVTDCTLAGGGWSLTTVKQEVMLRNYARYSPATDIPDSPKSGWVLTADDEVSPPAGYVWAVSLNYGDVNYFSAGDHGGFVRGGRLVPASQEDLAVLA